MIYTGRSKAAIGTGNTQTYGVDANFNLKAIVEYAQKLDEKNRVTVPARLREPFGDGLFVTRGLDKCVAIYARDGWDAFVEQQTARLDPFTREGRQMERFLFGGAVEAELDRQGRIAVPPPLMQHAALQRVMPARPSGEAPASGKRRISIEIDIAGGDGGRAGAGRG